MLIQINFLIDIFVFLKRFCEHIFLVMFIIQLFDYFIISYQNMTKMRFFVHYFIFSAQFSSSMSLLLIYLYIIFNILLMTNKISNLCPRTCITILAIFQNFSVITKKTHTFLKTIIF
jgi:hypothetical protein